MLQAPVVVVSNDAKKDEIAKRAAQECAKYLHGQQTRPAQAAFEHAIREVLTDYEALRETSGEGEK